MPKQNTTSSSRYLPKLLQMVKSNIHIIIFLIYSIFLFREYFLTQGYPVGTDMLGWVRRTEIYTRSLDGLHIWEDGFLGGVHQFILRPIPLIFLNLLFHTPVTSVKLYTFFIFFLTLFSMYHLAFYYTKDKTSSILAAFIYATNPLTIGKITSGHLNFSLSYALFPFIVLFFEKTLRGFKLKNLLIFSLIFGILPTITRLDLPIYIVPLLLIIFFVNFNYVREMHLSKLLSSFSIFLFIVIGLNLYFLIPSIFGVKASFVSSGSAFAIENLLWWSFPISKTFLGFNREVGYLAFTGGIKPPLNTGWHPFLSDNVSYLIMCITPVVALSSIIISRNRTSLIYGLILIISIPLATGIREPFGGIYNWLYLNTFFGIIRAPTRWSILIWFAFSILICMAVASIKRRDTYHKKLKLFVAYTLVSLLIVSQIISVWGVFPGGFKTWTIPAKEVDPHNWIKKNTNGDFRIATFPYYQRGMDTDYGRSHDIGLSSKLFHGKSVVGEGGWVGGLGRTFVKYTKFLTENEETNDFLKILNLLNVKYIVIQSYNESSPLIRDDIDQKAFLYKQVGYNTVYAHNGTKIVQNPFWNGRIWGSNKRTILVGGLEAIPAILKIPSLELNRLNTIFVQQLGDKQRIYNEVQESDLLIFMNTNMSDLALLASDGISIDPYKYATPSTDYENNWVIQGGFDKGYYMHNEDMIVTNGPNEIKFEFSTSQEGKYDLWFHLLEDQNRGEIEVYFDGNKKDKIKPYSSPTQKFRWYSINNLPLGNGKHELLIKNNISRGGSYNHLDQIKLIKPEELKRTYRELSSIINKKQVIFIYEAEAIQSEYSIPLNDINASNGKYIAAANEIENPLYGFSEVWVRGIKFKDSERIVKIPLADIKILNGNTNSNYKKGILELNLGKNRKYKAIFQKDFKLTIDNNSVLDIYLKFNVYNSSRISNKWGVAFFSETDQNWVTYSFVPRKGVIQIPLSEPSAKKGEFKWNKVTHLRLIKYDKHTPSNITISDLSIVKANKTRNYGWYLQNVSSRGKVNLNNYERIDSMLFFKDISRLYVPESFDIEYKKISSVKYNLHIKSSKDGYLMFSENFDPNWKLYIGKEKTSPIPSYYFMNSFKLPKGDYDATLYYEGERYFKVGGILTLIVFIFTLLMLRGVTYEGG